MKQIMKLLTLVSLLTVPLFFAGCKTAPPLEGYQSLSDQVIFERAQSSMGKHQYDQASKDLEALDTLYPFGDYSQKGQLLIINAYYKNEETDLAYAAADRYIRLYPRSTDVDYAYYMKGVINAGATESWYQKWAKATPAQRDLSTKKQALDDFKTLVTQFPNSQYVPPAKQQIAQILNVLVQHELDIADYYFRRATYIAAANRASSIVSDYPEATQMPAALAMMVKSYRALNQPSMANTALSRLLSQYPASSEAKQLGALKN